MKMEAEPTVLFKKHTPPFPVNAGLKTHLKALKGGDDDRRASALEAIVRSDAPDVVSAIFAIKDEEEALLGSVQRAFIRAGAGAVQGLLAALECEETAVQSFAERALSEINDISAIEIMISALSHESLRVRQSATRFLTRAGAAALSRLIELVSGGNDEQRRLATEILGSIGDRKAVDPLILALGDASSDVRTAALWAIEEIGKPALSHLRRALEDGNALIRQGALDILINMGDRNAVHHIIGALATDNRDIRWRAAEALGRIGDASSIATLIGVLKDPDADLRKVAASALADIGQQAVIPLLESLDDRSTYLRQGVESALAQMGPRAIDAIIARMQTADEHTKNLLIGALEKMGDAAREALAKKISHKDPLIRAESIRILGKVMDESLIEPVMKRMKDEDKGVRWQAAETLARYGEAVLNPLMRFVEKNRDEGLYEASIIMNRLCDGNSLIAEKLADHPSNHIRRIAVRSLGINRIARAVPILKSHIHDHDKLVREASAWALGEIGDSSASETLVKELLDPSREEEMPIMLWAIIKISNPSSVAPLIGGLASESAWVRYRAASALGHSGSRQAVQPLLTLLADIDPRVRKTAVQSLGMIAAPEAEEPIKTAMINLARDEWMIFREALRKIRKQQQASIIQ